MKIKLLHFLAISFSLSGLLFAVPAFALSPAAPLTGMASLKTDACAGLDTVDSTQGCGVGSQSAVTRIVNSVVNVLSLIVGIVAVLIVIIAGFKYITSAGDAGKISSAKNTLIYAIIGLIIVALAQIIVHFVINTSANAAACPVGQTLNSVGKCVVPPK